MKQKITRVFRVLKKLKKISFYKNKNYYWLRVMGRHYEKQYSRIKNRSIRSNIIKRNARPLISMSNDLVIEDLLKSKKYSFETMLVILDPYHIAPLTALVVFNTKEEYKVLYEVIGDTKEESFFGETEFTTDHRVEILGLYADRTNVIMISLENKKGEIVQRKELSIKTDSIPAKWRDIIRVKKKTRPSSEPFILISGGTAITTCAFDVSGNIRYYLSEQSKGYGIFLLSNGRFLYEEKDINRPTHGNPHAIQIHEMDFSGRVYKTFYVPKGIHHNASEMTEGGNIIACASTCDEYLENAVIELDRNTGEVTKELSLNQIFDDTCIDRIDWAHVNAVTYQEKTQTILISMRNIHSIAKIDWKTNELVWILSNPKFWEHSSLKDKVLIPQGEIKWFYQQHAVVDVSDQFEYEENVSFVLLYDNHVDKRRKVSYFDEDKNSYASIFRIDEKNFTVTMVEKYPFYKSTIRSNAVLKRDKKRIFSMGGHLQPTIEENYGLIAEMDTQVKESINEYFVKTGFFTAYPFRPYIKEISRPMPILNEYVLGGLEKIEKIISIDKTQFKNLAVTNKKDINNIRICEDIILIKARDHAVEQVYLVGTKHCYRKDFSDTKQTLSIFANMLYSVAVPLYGLENDSYKIYVNVRGTLKNTRKWVKISIVS